MIPECFPLVHIVITGSVELFSQYDRNVLKNVFTMNLTIEGVPADQKLLRSEISSKIKPDGKDMWKFQPFHCNSGSTHIRGSDFTK